MNDLNWYKQGVRCLFAINRKKDGGTHNGQRHSILRISFSPTSFDGIVQEFQTQCQKAGYDSWRIYSSVNPRSFQKASRLFRRKLIDWETHSEIKQLQMYAEYKDIFFSCLMKPECADDSLFLIDIDGDNRDHSIALVGECQKKLNGITTIKEIRGTPNGHHIICEPYNPALTPELEIKKDASILVNWNI